MEEDEVTFWYKTAKAPETLSSGGLGPCIAVGAIYREKGYMLHSPPTQEGFGKLLDPLFIDLKREVRDKNWVKIYVIGGESSQADNNDDVMAAQNAVIDKIAAYGFSKCIKEIRWCPPNSIQKLDLILSEGRGVIEDEEME